MGSSTEHSRVRADGQPVGPGPRARRLVAAAPRRPSPRSTPRCRSGPTPAARSASRRPCAGSSGMKPTYGRGQPLRDRGVRQRLDQIGPFARDVARRGGAAPRGRRPRRARLDLSAPVPVPDDLLRLPGLGRRGRLVARAASGSACRSEYFVAGHGARRGGADPRGGRGARGGRRDGRGGQPPAHRLRARDVLHRRARRRRRRTSPATTASATATASAAAATTSRTTSRPAASGFGPEVKRRIMLGTYALSAGYYDAFYLKAQKVRTLIKRDFDAPVGAGLRRPRRARPRRRSRSGSAPGWPTRSQMYLSDACTLPVNMAGLPGHLGPVRPVRGPAGRASS